MGGTLEKANCGLTAENSLYHNYKSPRVRRLYRSQSKQELLDNRNLENSFKKRCDEIIFSVVQNTTGLIDARCKDENTGDDKVADAIRYAEYQRQFAVFENNELFNANVWYNIGSLYERRARELLEKMNSTILTEIEPDMDNNAISNEVSVIDENMLRALSCYCKSVLFTKTLNDYDREGNLYGCIGNILHLLGSHEEAIGFHLWRLDLARQLGDGEGEYRALQNIGNEYVSLSRFGEAVRRYNEAKLVAIRMNDVQRKQRCQELIEQFSEMASKKRKATGRT
nr:C. briggsae CBR-AGS-3 protein [Haemonchus contortus]